jgi:D-3-phosphoglycerate dehydrogenase
VIIGFGRIGQCVARLLSSFGVRILVVDPHLENYDGNYPVLLLEDALPQAEVITIHSSGQECILGEREFSLIKPGAYLLNAARGGLVSEDSLMRALDRGIIAGGWLDVFENEPYDGPLKEYEQVVLTPHVGSYTYECRKQMETDAVDSLIKALKKAKTED